jgi:hypothetical protein
MGKTTKTHATGTPAASTNDRNAQSNKPNNTPNKAGKTASKSRQKPTSAVKFNGAAAEALAQDVTDRMNLDDPGNEKTTPTASFTDPHSFPLPGTGVQPTSASKERAPSRAATAGKDSLLSSPAGPPPATGAPGSAGSTGVPLSTVTATSVTGTTEILASNAPGTSKKVTAATAATATEATSEAADDDDAQSEATAKRAHTSAVFPPRAHQSRYDWKLKVKPSTKPVEALREALVTMFDQIKNEDKQHLVIYPWKADSAIDSKGKRITSSADIPKGVDELQKFFDRAYPRTKGGDIYVSVFLGHKKSFPIIHKEINWWLREMNFGFYLKSLQVERTVPGGWLLFSTQTMDVDAITPAIFTATGVDVGLRWRVINTGRNADIPVDQRVRALHIEVDAEYQSLDLPLLRKLYSSSRTKDFPLGIRMRLVPEFGELVNRGAQTKVERLRNRQAAFTHHMAKVESWEIACLDFRDPALDDRSLRNFLMEIPSTEYPHLNLFHSVDKKWKGISHVFMVLPQLEVEARAMIAGLVTYLRFIAGSAEKEERMLKFFTVEAGERSLTSHWDVARGCVVSEYDTLVDDLDTGLEDTEYFFELTAVGATPVSIPVPMAATTLDIAMDEDTVSTFTHAGAGVFAHKVIPRKSRGSVDSSSKLSAGTTETRLSTMENSVQALLTNQQEQSQTLKDLVALLAAGTVPKPPSPPGDSTQPKAGGSNVTGPAS